MFYAVIIEDLLPNKGLQSCRVFMFQEDEVYRTLKANREGLAISREDLSKNTSLIPKSYLFSR